MVEDQWDMGYDILERPVYIFISPSRWLHDDIVLVLEFLICNLRQ
jgi:hypothetical protein